MDPVLKVNSTETIPLECVSLQTVLSKSLGPLNEWSDRLRVSTQSYDAHVLVPQNMTDCKIERPKPNII